jgi:Methyltransferase domain/C-methyltransferase C-terminal domain
MSRVCDACAKATLVPFADLGDIPVLCGVHWADADEAAKSPVGRMSLAYCPECAYVRNIAFDPSVMVYDTTMDTNLHHSPAFQKFSAELVSHLGSRFALAGRRVLDIGCGQGEFLRELCHHTGCTGVGYDAMYAGPEGPDPSGATFHSGFAPRGSSLPPYDMVTSRHWFEHIEDPYEFLVDLREQAGGRPVSGYLEVPDAVYDLATAGWEVIYPHVSYFDANSLCRIVERAGWRVEDTGTLFSGMFRFIEISANEASPRRGTDPLPGPADAERQLAAVAGFGERHRAERDRWRDRIASLAAAGANPVLWGAGSRGVQFLTLADPQRRLSAVVDLNPRKWGRFLPVTAHEVSSPESLVPLNPTAVIITNPAYRGEIGAQLESMGISAEILVA